MLRSLFACHPDKLPLSLTIFDNGSAVPGRAPRVVRVDVDSKARTATVLGTISDPLVPASACCGEMAASTVFCCSLVIAPQWTSG